MMNATLRMIGGRVFRNGWMFSLAAALAAGGVARAVCVDNDGDGYGNPASMDCTHPQLDCNDNNFFINPGRPELCDGVDNNCSGVNNEGFDVGDPCEVVNPPGCMVGDPAGCCVTGGTKVCTPNGLGTMCLTGDVLIREPEGPGGNPSCFDLVDNDCDGLVDHEDPACQTAEFCNGFDDDNDGTIDEGFPNLGMPCSVGVGACTRNGLFVCNAMGTGTVCSVVPGAPGVEGPAGGLKCSDGIDNDCDGLTDLNDPDCQGPEKCDGLDNNGNGMIDEDFPDLGDPCTVGLGQCQANGVRVCAPGGLTTRCGATPGLASPEGPTGPTCNDGIDNDCDGFTDNADSNCNSAALMARCALLPVTGLGRDKPPHVDTCTSWHQIDFDVMGVGGDAQVSAELYAINADGVTLHSVPVEWGDYVEFAALPFADSCIVTQTGNHSHRVYAPVAMLRVTVNDGNSTAQAFCTNIPYLDVIEPSGQVVSASEGDVMPVLAAIPQVDPSTLFVKVDGVDVLAAMGINPATDFPGGPYGADIMVNGKSVEVSELIVKLSELGTLDSNIISMKLSGLGGGGHIVVVDADPHPTALPFGWPASCYEDDVRDKGEASGFEITLTSPTPGQVTLMVPTPVIGEVCSGRPIGILAINGMSIDTSGQVFTPGDGENSADTYCFAFNKLINQTDLPLDIQTGNAPLGTFDRGTNRVVIDALDDISSRSFVSRIFATGNVGSQVVNLPNAFNLGIRPEAIQKLFSARIAGVGQQFIDGVKAKLQEQANNPQILHVEFDCCCDVNAKVRPVAPFATGNPNQISAVVTFMQDKFKVRVNLPDLTTYFAVDGKCEEEGLFGECIARSRVAVDVNVATTGMWFEFEVTENQILGIGLPSAPVFEKGTSTPTSNDRGTGTGCWGCDLCSGLAVVAGFLLDLITLGFLDPQDNPFYNFLIPSFEVIATEDAVQDAVGSSQPDPIELGEIKVDEETISQYQQTLMADLDIVEISTLGLKASLKATFQTASIDPTIPPVPGAVLTPAPAPGFPSQVAGAEDVYVLLADDVLNQMFASMAASGLLKANCQDTGKTLGTVLELPADCETIVGMSDNETAAQQGRCHGFKGADCSTIPVVMGMGLGIIERATCNLVRGLNLRENTPLLVCAQQEVPPRLLIDDDTNTFAVESTVRLNDLSVAIIADRDADGMTGDLLGLRNCFQQGASTVDDCNLFAVCLDLNIMTQMQFQTCADGKPGITTTPTAIATTIRQLGVVCGAAAATNDGTLTDAAGTDPQVMEILNDLDDFTPPLCANGLNLGGFVNFSNPKLIAVDVAGGDPHFSDYLGITGDIDP